MVFSGDFPIFDWQYPRVLLEEFCKAAGGGITNHLCDLTHGKVGVDEQMLRLAHALPLDILCDCASGVPLKAGFEFACAHAGDACKALQRDVKGVMIGNIGFDFLK